jgi:hypothetical protein
MWPLRHQDFVAAGRLVAAAAAAEPPHLHTVPRAALSPCVAESSLRSTTSACTLELPLPLHRLDAGTSCSATTHMQHSLLASADAAVVRAPLRRRQATSRVHSPTCVHHMERACCRVATFVQRFSLPLGSADGAAFASIHLGYRALMHARHGKPPCHALS